MPAPSRNIRLRFLKILFYLVSFSLLLLACQQEEIPDTSFGEDSENDDIILSINNLTSRDIQENMKLNTAVKEINEITISDYTTRSTNSESNDSEPKDTSPIQLEYATEIISSKNNTFTFQLAKKAGAQDDSALYNIVFIERDEGDFQAIGVKYDFSEDQAEIFYNTGQIDGEVRVIFFSIKNFKDKPKYTTRSVFAGNICDNIKGGMDCGSLDDVILIGGKGRGGSNYGGGVGGFYENVGGGEDRVGPIRLKVDDSKIEGGGGGYTIPVVNKDKNPCDKIASLFEEKSFKDKFKELKGKTGKSREYGYSQDKNGNFTELKPDGNHRLKLPNDSKSIGFLHTHPTTPMFSPADFLSFRNMLNAAEHSSDRTVEDVYGIMIHKDAMYMLKFDANYREVALRFNKKSLSDTELDRQYDRYFERYENNLEKAFIKFIEGVIFDGSLSFEDGFHLYEVKTDNKGSLKKSIEKYADKKPSNCK